ncbi:MAG: tetratricopeptide repeat protein, partial [Candidatus Hydrogenedentes bacterium]|nr:tetratricopeptide repeat protein [Candidatus Hydrogenedentota bacterium]
SSGETDTLTRAGTTFTYAQRGVNLRGVFWGAALLMAADRPVFGFGLGTYEYYVQRYQGKLMAALGPMSRLQPNELDTVTAHNDFLQLASELGCAGVAVVVWGLFVLWRCVRQRLSREMDPDSRCVLLASLAGLLGVAVFAGTNFPFHIVTHALVCMFLLAVVSGAGDAESAVYRRWRAPDSAVLRSALSLCVIAVGAAFLSFVMQPYVADYHVAYAYAIESAEPGAEAALERLKQAVRIEPRNGRIRAQLGRAYLARGMIDEAKVEFVRALKDYDSAWVHMDFGSACEAQGDLDGAAQHFSDAVFRAPRYRAAHERLVWALIEAGRYEEARERCHEAFRWVGVVPELLNVRAVVADREGDREGCVALLRRSLEMKPDQSEIRALLERVETEMQKEMTESRSEP